MYYFIVNPGSGCGHGKKIWETLRRELERQKISYRSFLLHYKGEARVIAGELSKLQHPFTAVIVGGDGTINEFLSGITTFRHITLGCIPTGSGNDFVRGLGLERSPLEALGRVLHPTRIKRLKVGTVTGEYTSASGEARQSRSVFIISSGIGFDADVCNGAYSSGTKRFLNWFHAGKLIYLATALKLLLSMGQYPMKITLEDGRTLTYDAAFFATVMNMAYEGGGFQFAPKALPESEDFQLCIAEGLTRRRILRLLPLAFSGRHVGKQGIHILECKKAVIQTAHPLCVHTDGEILGFCHTLTLEALPEKLSVIVQ